MAERKAVYTVVERKDKDGNKGKSFWCRVGSCFTNRDGSFSVVLDALPLDGRLVIRDEQPRDEASPRRGGGGSQRNLGDAFSDGNDEIPF